MKETTPEEIKAGLGERLSRYTRFLDNEDALKTLDDVDAWFELHTSIFSDLRTNTMVGKESVSMIYQANAKEWIAAKEGARAYSQMLRNLVKATEAELKEGEDNE